jgi:predicted nucleic acid-binding protein
MGLNLQPGQKIFVDTAPLVYLMEGQGLRAEKVAGLLELSTKVNATWVTSLVTYMEILVLPTREGQAALAGKYRDFLTNSDQISLHPLDVAVADVAVELRARHRLKVPDAVQLATARVSGADLILTNDRSWAVVPGPRIVCVDDL